MKNNFTTLSLFIGFIFCAFFTVPSFSATGDSHEQAVKKMKKSPGKTTYYVDPQNGKDTASGRGKNRAWKTFLPLSKIRLSAGDTVVVAPGTHEQTLSVANGAGTTKSPITIKFLSGKHIFASENLRREIFNISNTNDRPNEPKAVAIRIYRTKNISVVGEKNAEILMEGKTIYVVIDRSQDVELNGLAFDYLHPTVGEFRVTARNGNTLDVSVPKEISYTVRDGKLTWTGPGWSFPLGGFIKIFNPDSGTFSNGNFDPSKTRVEELSPGKLRIHYNSGAPNLSVGQVLQNRDTTRDCVGFLQRESKNIRWFDCKIYSIHGMGVVSQFSENISFDKLAVRPRENSERTNVAWADILHFSGCKGVINITDSLLSCSHDDAVNVHGTHLRVVERVNDKTLVVRFMHKQTFGFQAFFPGDEVEFVHGKSLQAFGENVVSAVEMLDDRRIKLTFKNSVPKNFEPEDAVENVTWTPSVNISNVTVLNVPTRGFLVTTRRPVVIEKCTFKRTGMSAILVEDDASGWFESGPVKNMIIRKNKFIECAEPVININPHATEGNAPVHKNIRIERNTFKLVGNKAIRAHHAENVTESGNNLPKSAVEIR